MAGEGYGRCAFAPRLLSLLLVSVPLGRLGRGCHTSRRVKFVLFARRPARPAKLVLPEAADHSILESIRRLFHSSSRLRVDTISVRSSVLPGRMS